MADGLAGSEHMNTHRMTATQVRRAFDQRTIVVSGIHEANVESGAHDLFLKLRAAWPAWVVGHAGPDEHIKSLTFGHRYAIGTR